MFAKGVFPTSVISALVLSIVAATLVGCGNGGGNESFASEASSGTGELDAYAAVRPAQGDWVMYAHSVTSPGGVVTRNAYLTRTYFSVSPDGSVMYSETSSDTGAGFKPLTTTLLDPNGGLIRYSGEGGQFCTIAPAFTGVATISPGFERIAGNYPRTAAWNNNAQSNCEQSGGVMLNAGLNNTGSIVAVETVTVQGREYSTVKEVYTSTATTNAEGQSSIRKMDYTCWRDTVRSRMVKCIVTQSSKPFNETGFKEDYTSTYELVGFSLYRYPLRLPPVSQYAGNWMLYYSGTEAGNCASIHISTDGTISGDCPITPGASMQGRVTSSGEFTLATADGANFTGLLRTPIDGNGSWTTPSGGGGAWSISHR